MSTRETRLSAAALSLLSLLTGAASVQAAVEEGGIVRLPPTRVERLIINHPQGSLTLRGWDRGDVSISFHKKAPSDALLEVLHVQVDVVDGVMKIRSGIESRGELRGLPQPDSSIELTIDAPRGTPVLASTFNGALRVNGFQNSVDVGSQTGAVHVSNITGTVRTHTGRGDQWIRAISGEVDAHGVVGDLRFYAVAGPSLSAQVVSGQITAQDIRARLLRLHAAVGTVYLLGPLLPGARYELMVDEGDLQIGLPSGPAPRFSVDAAAPQIQVRYPLDAGAQVRPGSLRGDVHGGGPLLQLQSTRGRISISPAATP